MEETREETPQDLRNLALKVAGLLEEAGQHALHDQLNPRNLAQPSTENVAPATSLKWTTRSCAS